MNCGYGTGQETYLWQEIPRGHATATCAFGLAYSPSVKGFKPMGSTVRMYKGVMPRGHDSNVYGLACLELD